jgi:hypothetical protein
MTQAVYASFPIDLSSVEESNLFLRALWASLRSEFGHLAWQYSPHRDGPNKRITLGIAQIGGSGSTMVNVIYRQAGCISSLEFSPVFGEAPSNDQLEAAVVAALGTFKKAHSVAATSTFSLGTDRIAFATYASQDVRIESQCRGKVDVTLTLSGFDNRDIDFQYQLNVGPILDLLACWTNCVVYRFSDRPATVSTELEQLTPNTLWIEDDWIDGIPLVQDRIGLSRDQLAALQASCAGELPLTDPLIRAARHFREGLELYQTYKNPSMQVSGDLVNALFMSALEVISLRDTKEVVPCSQCGQPQHRISSRIRDLGTKHLGAFGKDFFAKRYNGRSGFLHAGEVSGSYPVQAFSCPQLAPKSPTGCAVATSPLDTFNLREFCSYVLRKECLRMFPETSL